MEKTILFLLLFCLPFCLGNERNIHSSAKHSRQRQALPLRDDDDYLRAGVEENDYFDEGSVVTSKPNIHHHKYGIPEKPQSLRTPKTKRRDSTMKIKMESSLESVLSAVDTQTPTTIGICPSECTCLNDFMSCSQLQSDQIPRIPQYISSLELFHSQLSAELCEQNIRNVKNLMAVRVNNNKLTRIPVLQGLVSLEKLELMNNEIRTIAISALRALPKLTYLDLSGNKILNIDTNAFPKINALQKLILNNNHIDKLERRSFETLTHLHELKMNGNRITHLPTGIFNKLKKLKKLDLNNNQLTGLNKDGLLNLTSLTWLDASNNSINSIGKDCWEFTQRIVHLDLSGNQIEEITFGTFHTLTRLKYLNLNRNIISTIKSNAMNATPHLELLDLSRNKISWAVEDSIGPFAALTKLNALDLSGNHIKAITRNAFIGLYNLTKLDLRYNNITTIQNDAFDGSSTPALQHILIDSKDLICDCHLTWFYLRFKSMQFTRGQRISVSCAYPAFVRNKPLLSLNENDFTCDTTPKPQMIDAPKTPLIAIRGENITIECSAFLTAGSDIEFIWKHDNVEISEEFIQTITMQKTEAQPHMNEKMIDYNKRFINNRVQFAPLAAHTDDDYTNYGDDYDGDDTKNESDYNTEKIDSIGAPVEDIQANIPMNSTIATSRLTLVNVHDRHAGRYQCIASNMYGKAYSQKFRLSVASFPVFTKRPTNVTTRTTETIRLQCAVDADPKPQIYWQFNFGNDFPAARERRMHMVGNDTIVIKAAKSSDHGVYTCTAENPAGIISINVTVDIIEPLVYIRPIETKETIAGECAVLECSNSESALSGIRWYKNSKPIWANDKRFVLAQGNRLLIIAKTTEEDDGLYTCEMENSLGKEKLMIKLSIYSKPIRIDKPKVFTRDEYVKTIVLTSVCWAFGISFIWLIIICLCRKGSKHLNASNLSISEIGRTTPAQAHASSTATDSKCYGNKVTNLSSGIYFDRNTDCLKTNKFFPTNALGLHSDSINNDNEALLGAKCSAHQSHKMRHSNFIAKIRGIDKAYRQHNSSIENTSTITSADEPYSSKTKMSSLSSSCNSIPALSFNSTHELDTNKMRNYESLPKNFSNGIGNSTSTDKPKPNIHTNELNELISALEIK